MLREMHSESLRFISDVVLALVFPNVTDDGED